MELIKRDIQMTRSKGRAVAQLTLDDDFNVPDIKPDIDKILQERGEIKLSSVEPMNDKVKISGALVFHKLYISDEDSKPVHNMSGSIPFEEIVNLDGVKNHDLVKVGWEIDDLSTGLINSRKVNVRSIVTLNVEAEEEYVSQAAVGVEGIKDLQSIHHDIDISQLQINKKDIYRIRDEIGIPANKPNIMEILWNTAEVKNAETKLYDDKLNIKGDISLFVLFMGEQDDKPVEFVELDIPFNGIVECFGCKEEMISNVQIQTADRSIEVKQDMDGEDRVLDIEIVLDLDMRIYNQEKIKVLKDVYAPSKELKILTTPATYENLLQRNNTQCKVSEKVRLGNGESKILQICHTDGNVKVDEINTVENGIQVEGVVFAQILYVAADDKRPLNLVKEAIPFKHFIDIKGIHQDSIYQIKPSIEQISCSMLDSQEIEVKSVINMNALVFNQVIQSIITEIEEEPIDMRRMYEVPSIVAYVVKPGDTLWEIAKRFYTTVDRIMMLNGIDDETNIQPGDKLIIIKNVEEIIE